MLNLILGRENVNKEKYAFEKLSENALVIVPEQYTLEAEKDALRYQNKKGIMETQVLSFSRLGQKIFNKTGAPTKEILDKQGRHILIAKILKEKGKEFTIFKNQEGKMSFIEMINDFISQLKINDITSKQLRKTQEELDEGTFLKKKLQDATIIFEEYEKSIEGKYTDTEDYISLYLNKIKEWEEIKDKEVLIYGFDYFTPKNLQVIKELLTHTKDVYVLLTCSDDEQTRDDDNFEISKRMIEKLTNLAAEEGITVNRKYISSECITKKVPSLLHLEKEVFAFPAETFKGEATNITLLKGANYYSEAERAALYFLSLIRDKGLKFKDIALICNDLSTRGNIYKRVFKRYGIDIFLDEKAGINNVALVRYIRALIDIKSKGFQRNDLIKLTKTNLTEITSYDEIETLEQFATKYKVAGNRWKTPFPKWEEKEEEQEILECLRKKLVEPLVELFKALDEKKTVGQKLDVLYDYLKNTVRVEEKISWEIDRLLEENKNEEALFQSQVYKTMVDVFTQLKEVVGSEKMSFKNMGDLIQSGFDATALAIVPPTADMSILGTVQRTRTGEIKALMILGANEGVLPKELGDKELIGEEEKEILEEKKLSFLKMKELKKEEEQLAIYKMLAKPTDFLWISYAASNGEGEDLKPAAVFEKIEEGFPNCEKIEETEKQERGISLVGTKESTLNHLSKKLREIMEGKEVDSVWLEVANWYKKNQTENYEIVKRGLVYQNQTEQLGGNVLAKIYKNGGKISPSSIEKYARCPFAHFVKYGLRPIEERQFALDSADVGSIYHEVLMYIAQQLTEKEIKITAIDSPWMKISKSQLDQMVEETLSQISKTYRQGLTGISAEEKNKAQMMLSVCQDSAWAMVTHVKDGEIERMYLEEAFGEGKSIGSIKVKLGNGETMEIEGKIDRVDKLPDEYIKIIDYKSSKTKFNKDKATKGWNVQLFLYLEAMTKERGKPAGTFYFHIVPPLVDGTYEESENIMGKFWSEYKMDGVMINRRQVLEYMDKGLVEAEKKSVIINAETKKGNQLGERNKNILSEEDFKLLSEEIYKKVEDICQKIWEGKVEINPTTVGSGDNKESGCAYCHYRPICKKEKVVNF